MSEAGVCRGEGVDAIYGGAHRPRVQVLNISQVQGATSCCGLDQAQSKKSLLILN